MCFYNILFTYYFSLNKDLIFLNANEGILKEQDIIIRFSTEVASLSRKAPRPKTLLMVLYEFPHVGSGSVNDRLLALFARISTIIFDPRMVWYPSQYNVVIFRQLSEPPMAVQRHFGINPDCLQIHKS